MTEPAATPGDQRRAPSLVRWWQLFLGVICMSMVANLQYGWTLFVDPINDKHHWGRPAIQATFSIFILVETWLVPLEGYLVDRVGPKVVGVGSGVLVALAWVINSSADSLPLLYLGAVIGGIGVGGVYGATVGNALKWFPDRRGLASGLTAMGFGAGSALTVVPIANMIKAQGYEATFLKFGIIQGAVVFVVGWLLKAPPAGFTAPKNPAARVGASPATERTPLEMAQTPAFWIMYVMFVLTATFGLIATAQLTAIAKDFHVTDSPVALFGLTMAALPFALATSRILNGVTRPFFGWVSDHLGRENTMFVAFSLEGVAILLLGSHGGNATAFVLLTCLVYFGFGEIFSLFPAICGDTYGKKFAAANAGLLYTAKGAAALLVVPGGLIATKYGWHVVFVAGAAMSFVAAIMALLVLKPVRTRMNSVGAIT